FGWFLIAWLFQWGNSTAWLFRLVVAGMGAWLMAGAADSWLAASLWTLGVLWPGGDPELLWLRACLRVAWAFATAFLAAAVASMAGLDPEVALETHRGTVLAWCLLYFGGIALAGGWRHRAFEKSEIRN